MLIKKKNINKILVIRTDRIGDVILSTPTLQALREGFPEAHMAMLVSPYTKDIVEDNPFLDEIIIDDEKGKHYGWKGFLLLLHEIKSRNFDVAIILYSKLRVGLLTYLSRIPVRIGPASKLHTFFLYNHRISQHRSQALKSEADYNLDLVKPLGVNIQNKETTIHISKEAMDFADKFIIENGLIDKRPLIIIHPGMGGSAKNWKKGNYALLADKLIQDFKAKVLLTGGADEETLIRDIAGLMEEKPYTLPGKADLKELAAIISKADLFIGPSTGPMHIAAAVKTPLITIFSPIKVHNKIRWGPYGTGDNIVINPEVKCKEQFHCKKDCPYYDCMDMISPESVLEKVSSLFNKKL